MPIPTGAHLGMPVNALTRRITTRRFAAAATGVLVNALDSPTVWMRCTDTITVPGVITQIN
ncbi:hypothetical protein GTS_51970 [Gandjariella thermophila]|uniref:Uncharacterized protein n=1 Tax=Gandjariella thermophila TaxID=1931992 RepID=A0A4D4JD55_9PSEU|nr:hypothetical protein GTS_51970 [Gandjariella thermophila]